MEKIVLFAGEPSGDLHGSHLLQKLIGLLPAVEFVGVGGPKMRDAGLKTLLYSMEDFAVMGFIDVIKSLPALMGKFRQLTRKILQENPRAVVLIDYPDFNLRLAKSLRKQGYQGKIVHYISPSVWAWRANRITAMAENLDLLLTIYPFESSYYADCALPVTFVGNPLSEYIAAYHYDARWKEVLGMPEEPEIMALFPGSRKSELYGNLPLQLQAVELLLKHESSARSIAISCSAPEHVSLIWQQIAQFKFAKHHRVFIVPHNFTYELMRDARVALAKSGTVTLELALHHCPTVVIYKLSRLNYCIAKYLVRMNLPYYCIVNILAQKEIFPEHIHKNISPKSISTHLKQLAEDSSIRVDCLAACRKLTDLLQGFNTSELAAHAIFNKLEHHD